MVKWYPSMLLSPGLNSGSKQIWAIVLCLRAGFLMEWQVKYLQYLIRTLLHSDIFDQLIRNPLHPHIFDQKPFTSSHIWSETLYTSHIWSKPFTTSHIWSETPYTLSYLIRNHLHPLIFDQKPFTPLLFDQKPFTPSHIWSETLYTSHIWSETVYTLSYLIRNPLHPLIFDQKLLTPYHISTCFILLYAKLIHPLRWTFKHGPTMSSVVPLKDGYL